jgi:hypothetical protein
MPSPSAFLSLSRHFQSDNSIRTVRSRQTDVGCRHLRALSGRQLRIGGCNDGWIPASGTKASCPRPPRTRCCCRDWPLPGRTAEARLKPDESDGILTAEEIAGINLEGVDWAVLSACDTGVGEIKVGEGVFGLRRAFQVAGAKTVIMSLWPVEDTTTEQWMGTLYREHFLNGKDTLESVRAASLQILLQRRARHQSTHPFYWGAFIAAGDWH